MKAFQTLDRLERNGGHFEEAFVTQAEIEIARDILDVLTWDIPCEPIIEKGFTGKIRISWQKGLRIAFLEIDEQTGIECSYWHCPYDDDIADRIEVYKPKEYEKMKQWISWIFEE